MTRSPGSRLQKVTVSGVNIGDVLTDRSYPLHALSVCSYSNVIMALNKLFKAAQIK